MKCTYLGLSQPISTNNIMAHGLMASTNQSIFNFQWHRAKIHYDTPTFTCSNQNPLNVLSRLFILLHSEIHHHTKVRHQLNVFHLDLKWNHERKFEAFSFYFISFIYLYYICLLGLRLMIVFMINESVDYYLD